MYRVLTNEQMRAADAYTINNLGISSERLMRRAGQAIAEEVARAAQERRAENILVVCGTGNNGGDGYVCAEQLVRQGYAVKVYAIEGRLSEDCEREKNAYSGQYSNEIGGDIVVDCIFGTGLSREVTGKYAEVIAAINGTGAFVVAADIPSGINGDNGQAFGCAVKADLTVAIAEYKLGHVLSDGMDHCGKIIRKDIGITCPQSRFVQVYEDGDVRAFYPARPRNSHKGTFGTADVTAGSEKYVGAAALAVSAALQSGCGYVKLTTAAGVKTALAATFPQVIFLEEPDGKADCIAVGSGCGVSEELYGLICGLLKGYGGTLVIDADGLNSLAKYGVEVLKEHTCRVVLTPHVKEFSRLTATTVKEILADPVGRAEAFAREYGVVLLLKSAASVVTDGERTVVNLRGNTALSKGGSGDMLTGFLCGSIARGLSAFDGVVCAAYSLGLAAELSAAEKTEYCATAEDIVKNLFLSVKYLTE